MCRGSPQGRSVGAMADSGDNNIFRFTHLRAAKSRFRGGETGASPGTPAAALHAPAPTRTDATPVSTIGVATRSAERESRDLVSAKRELEKLDPLRDLNL